MVEGAWSSVRMNRMFGFCCSVCTPQGPHETDEKILKASNRTMVQEGFICEILRYSPKCREGAIHVLLMCSAIRVTLLVVRVGTVTVAPHQSAPRGSGVA